MGGASVEAEVVLGTGTLAEGGLLQWSAEKRNIISQLIFTSSSDTMDKAIKETIVHNIAFLFYTMVLNQCFNTHVVHDTPDFKMKQQ